MEAGTITGNSRGAAVVHGSFVMSGGSIAGNIGYIGVAENDEGIYIGGTVSISGEDSSFTMRGGSIRCNAGRSRYDQHDIDAYDLGAVFVGPDAVFSMEGGSITHNKHSIGGGVGICGSVTGENGARTVSGVFNLLDGEISGNESFYGGGGVFVYQGTFNMQGGSIVENKTQNGSGGGVATANNHFDYDVSHTDEGLELTFPLLQNVCIKGGRIGNNSSALVGGGIYLGVCSYLELSGNAAVTDNVAEEDGGGIYAQCGWFQIADASSENETIHICIKEEIYLGNCVISGNTAGGKGGGIYFPLFSNPESTEYPGTVEGTVTVYWPQPVFTVSGKTVITDNTSGSDEARIPDNLYLLENSFLTAGGDMTGSVIGITKEKVPTESEPVVFTKNLSGNGGATNFTSDDPAFNVRLNGDGEAMLGFFTYDVTLADTAHGSASASVGGSSNVTGLEPGVVVTLEVSPDEDYILDGLSVKMEAIDVPLTSVGDGVYTFEMPAADVTVQAAFRQYYFLIEFVDYDGSPLQRSKWASGETPVYSGDPPADHLDEQYTYSFIGWSPDIVPVTESAVYKAAYRSTVREYVITWKNDDGSLIDTTSVAYGQVPAHADAVKEDTAGFTYFFEKWSPDIGPVTGEATYTAVYTAVEKPVYTVTGGGDAEVNEGKAEDLVITVKRSPDDTVCFSLFRGLELDGAGLTEGTDYTAEAGSTVITIKGAVLNALAAGSHTVTALFEDGRAETAVNVTAAAETPDAGEHSRMGLWIGLTALAVLALGVCLGRKAFGKEA